MNEPPTRTWSSLPKMLSLGRQSQAAGGLEGDFWIASSMYGSWDPRCDGGDVIVKPPAFRIVGTWTSSHWPARNYHLISIQFSQVKQKFQALFKATIMTSTSVA